MRYAVLLVALLLAACGTEPAYLRHPDGRVAQCGPYMNYVAGDSEANAVRERGCIDDYQRQGFVRVPHP